MKTRIKTLLSLIVGWAFIGLGVIGLFLPVLQGILFLMVGLIILSKHYHFARRVLDRAKKRYPAAFDLAHRMKARLIKRFRLTGA